MDNWFAEEVLFLELVSLTLILLQLNYYFLQIFHFLNEKWVHCSCQCMWTWHNFPLIKYNDLNCLFDIFIVLYEEQFCLVYICRCRINSLPLQQTSHRHSCVTNAVSGTLAYLNLTQSCLSQNNIFLEWPEMRAKNDTWIFIR